MSATSTKLVSLHCQFHENFLRKMNLKDQLLELKQYFQKLLLFIPSSLCALQCVNVPSYPSHAGRWQISFEHFLGVFSFLCFPMTKELDEPNSTILKVLLLPAVQCSGWVWRSKTWLWRRHTLILNTERFSMLL